MARILGESLLRHNPQIEFVIGLVDLLDPSIDYQEFAPFEILPAHEIGIPDFDGMVLNYSIVELNTAVKPFYFNHLFKRHPDDNALKVCYFDPDISVYAPLDSIVESLDTSTVLLTPHILSPIPFDDKFPPENEFLNFGLYNLGFCGMRRSQPTDALVAWWSERLAKHCRIDVANGIFVDQLWMNFAPIFFPGVEISRHAGLNVAYWNLHERHLQSRGGQWYVNDKWPLVFYHFSNLPLNDSDAITKVASRFGLQDRPELAPLFEEYRTKLISYDIARYRAIRCAHVVRRQEWLQKQQRLFYRKHPHKFLVLLFKRAVPRWLKSFLRTERMPA